MNKAYSLVWNDVQGGWCAVSETARRRGKTGGGKRLLAAGVSLLGLAATSAYALPTGGAVASGKADIATSADGKTMSINQHTDKLITNWQDFSVAGGERVSFKQPDVKSIALNRVIGTNGSQIHGQIDANGKVFVVNPNGVVFGAGAQVNVGGLVASTKDISDKDFLAGTYRFSGTSGQSVENAGTIAAAEGGSVALLGAQVSNTGVIRAKAGRVALGAGDAFTVNFDGNGLLNLQVEGGAMDAQAHNGGLLSAEGGEVLMTARAANGLLNAVVNNSGTIEAQGLKERNGRIVLDGGLVQVAGKLNAAGGDVTTRGEQVKVAVDTQVDTRSSSGRTGTWTIESANASVANADAALDAATLSRALGTTNVALTNTSGDLTVNGAVNWASDHTLALTSQKGDVALKRAVAASGAKASVKANAAGEIRVDDKLALTGDQAHLELNAKKGHRFTQDNASATLSGRNASFSSNGEGYQVIHDVAGLRNVDRDLKGRYVLGNAIDGKGAAFQSIGANSAFEGVFDGLGNTVSRLNVTGFAPSIGLFSENKGRIANLELDSLTVNNQANVRNSQVGGLAGVNRGTISNVRATGMTVASTSPIRGESVVGGLVGVNDHGVIDGARFQGRISGNEKATTIGGIAGNSVGGARIANSRADAEITSKDASATGLYMLGGLVGMNLESTVSNSSSGGKLSAGVNAVAGGLVGYSAGGAIDHSTSSMAVSAGKDAAVGGAVGWNAGADLSNVSAIGNVSATSGATIGGLVGGNEGNVRDSWASGTVTAAAGSTIGGFVGSNDNGAISGSHASGNVSGNGAAAVGGFAGNNAGGVLADVSSKGRVTGAASERVGGLAGANTGTIRQAVAAGDVSAGNASKVGGLVAVNDGKIEDSRSSGTVRGGLDNTIGGLVGENNGTIASSSSTSNVAAGSGSYVGGLVGFNKGIDAVVSGSKAFGNVTVANGLAIGGFVGWNYGTIADSESSGTVTSTATIGGGFAGGNSGTIRLSGTSSKFDYPAQARPSFYGGFVGINTGSIKSSETTGAAASERFAGMNRGIVEAKR
ncbi:filamentous hemagglutinin N-terminal domain-containing protein [Burkholderia contaminans]|uniref:two-partner secretion domain-containing protein n=1 Tax=Burkholderia contaminans TaxID=488447 RepID=UPI001CF32120|nr:GLUG motif-containing protein [Burkholderia contaminans]MCA7919648.1 filamentous hemagglutinin N-terminal domain-containing protein [Burkholderia contaminans]UUX38692.1 filamentous hemagglutinin N-terminal domain-containing protein [Burkholderia contaminans]